MKLILILMLCLPAGAYAADSWSDADTYREAAVFTLSAVDYLTTMQIANKDDARETNPIIHGKPSPAVVTTYFATSMFLHYEVAKLLPHDWREGFQYISIGVELWCDVHNLRAGLSLGF